MTDQLIMTTAEREQLQNTLKQCWHTVSPETDPLIASSEALLQSLPMVDSEPVSLRDAVFKVCEGYTLHEGARKILETALFASPQALTPITAADVTDEMVESYINEAKNIDIATANINKSIIAAAYNAVI